MAGSECSRTETSTQQYGTFWLVSDFIRLINFREHGIWKIKCSSEENIQKSKMLQFCRPTVRLQHCNYHVSSTCSHYAVLEVEHDETECHPPTSQGMLHNPSTYTQQTSISNI